MKIAVLSDTHLRQVSSDFHNLMEKHLKGTDLVLHAGDWVITEVLGFFYTYPLYAVYGNMDDAYIKATLSYKQVVEASGFRLGLIHGWGSSHGLEIRIREKFEKVDAIIYGHSHQPTPYWSEDILFFNPGSVTLNRNVDFNQLSIGLQHMKKKIL